MKPKPDTRRQPQQTPGKAFSRRRLKTFMDQLQERTEVIGQFESILGIATGGDRDAPFRTADEVESLVIDVTRKLGNSTMRQRAQGAQELVIGDSKKEHTKARHKKHAELVVHVWEVRIEGIMLRTGTESHLRHFCPARKG